MFFSSEIVFRQLVAHFVPTTYLIIIEFPNYGTNYKHKHTLKPRGYNNDHRERTGYCINKITLLY